MVLNMVYDYASTNVRTNAVRAIHQLVECVANANPVKTLAKFFPLCVANIKTELENGASSLRTTSASRPLPSDATLHWNLAILRGAVYKCAFLFFLVMSHGLITIIFSVMGVLYAIPPDRLCRISDVSFRS